MEIYNKLKEQITKKENPEIPFRKNLKNEILIIAKKIKDEFRCNEPQIDIPLNSDNLIELASEFVESEKIIEKNIDILKKNHEDLLNTVNMLTGLIFTLTGPDTRPCILKAIASAGDKPEEYICSSI